MALEQSMKDGFTPTLAVVFTSIKQDRQSLREILQQKGIDLVGATSSGEFIDGHQTEGETAMLLLDINPKNYSILFEDIGERSIEDAGADLGKKVLQKFNNPAIILLSTGFTTKGEFLKGEPLLRSLENTVGSGVNIFGGMAGDDITFTGTHVFTNNESTDFGMVALVLNEDKIEFHGLAFSGWKPMGVSRTVTKSEGNLVYAIDGQPALETYLRLLGKELSSGDDAIKFFDSIGIHYPIQVEREKREPLMCNPIGFDREKKALICESDIPQGSRFRFSTPPDFDIVETVVGKAKEIKNQADADAEALLVFSCAGRLSAFGPMAHQENEGLSGVWNAPMAGFYTYGEFGRGTNGKHEFHSTTCCWVALKEK
jgi:hypothetical protein